MAVDNKFGTFEIPGIPEDEPVFVIRAKDAISAIAIDRYKEARLNPAVATEPPSEGWVEDIDEVIAQFVQWQADNNELVKLPD